MDKTNTNENAAESVLNSAESTEATMEQNTQKTSNDTAGEATMNSDKKDSTTTSEAKNTDGQRCCGRRSTCCGGHHHGHRRCGKGLFVIGALFAAALLGGVVGGKVAGHHGHRGHGGADRGGMMMHQQGMQDGMNRGPMGGPGMQGQMVQPSMNGNPAPADAQPNATTAPQPAAQTAPAQTR